MNSDLFHVIIISQCGSAFVDFLLTRLTHPLDLFAFPKASLRLCRACTVIGKQVSTMELTSYVTSPDQLYKHGKKKG